MSRLYKPAPVIEVAADEQGRPQEVHWRGEAYIGETLDHWRIQTGWWQDEILRDYYLWDSEDLLCVLYRDGHKQTWHMHRVYD